MRRLSFWMSALCGLIITVEAFGVGFWVGGAGVSANTMQMVPPQLDLDNQRNELRAAEAAKQQAEARVAELEAELQTVVSEVVWIRQHLSSGYSHLRKVVVDEPHKAYVLADPKLLMSVNSLSGREVLATFGTQSNLFSVGERFDFAFEDRACFLVLEESKRNRAVFNLGCE